MRQAEASVWLVTGELLESLWLRRVGKELTTAQDNAILWTKKTNVRKNGFNPKSVILRGHSDFHRHFKLLF